MSHIRRVVVSPYTPFRTIHRSSYNTRISIIMPSQRCMAEPGGPNQPKCRSHAHFGLWPDVTPTSHQVTSCRIRAPHPSIHPLCIILLRNYDMPMTKCYIGWCVNVSLYSPLNLRIRHLSSALLGLASCAHDVYFVLSIDMHIFCSKVITSFAATLMRLLYDMDGFACIYTMRLIDNESRRSGGRCRDNAK